MECNKIARQYVRRERLELAIHGKVITAEAKSQGVGGVEN
jgi:hypothetical protein